MIFRFYKNNSDNRKLNKDLTPIMVNNSYDVNVIYKNDVNKGTPTLELAFNENLYNNANYCYNTETGYYFYLSEPLLGANRMYYDCDVDLKQTYKEDILKLGCIIARQENEFNTYLVDEKAPVLNKRLVNTIKFPNGFSNNDSYILATTGV